MEENGTSTPRLAHDCHTVLGASEEMDVVLDPLQGKALVKKSRVGVAISLNLRAREKPECAESIVDTDKYKLLIESISRLLKNT